MTFNTAYNHCQRLKSRMRSIYSATESYCSPHDTILQDLKDAVWSDPALAKCPSWVRQSLSAYGSELFNRVQRDLLVWLYELPDGTAVDWDSLPEDVRLNYCKPEGPTGKHYWLRRDIHRDNFGKLRNVKTGDTVARHYVITDKPF